MEKSFEDGARSERPANAERPAENIRRQINKDVGRVTDLALELNTASARYEQQIMRMSPEERQSAVADYEQIDPTVRERYGAASLLLSAAAAVLTDGMTEGNRLVDDDPGYLVEKIGAAIGQYGLRIERDDEPSHRKQVRTLKKLQRQYTTTQGDTQPSSETPND